MYDYTCVYSLYQISVFTLNTSRQMLAMFTFNYIIICVSRISVSRFPYLLKCDTFTNPIVNFILLDGPLCGKIRTNIRTSYCERARYVLLSSARERNGQPIVGSARILRCRFLWWSIFTERHPKPVDRKARCSDGLGAIIKHRVRPSRVCNSSHVHQVRTAADRHDDLLERNPKTERSPARFLSLSLPLYLDRIDIEPREVTSLHYREWKWHFSRRDQSIRFFGRYTYLYIHVCRQAGQKLRSVIASRRLAFFS